MKLDEWLADVRANGDENDIETLVKMIEAARCEFQVAGRYLRIDRAMQDVLDAEGK